MTRTSTADSGREPTRILFLASRQAAPDSGVRSGASVHAAASLAALGRCFSVLPVFAPGGDAAGPTAPASLRRFLPARVRGLRQDARFVSEDRAAARRALAAAEGFAPEVVYERNEYLSLAGRRVAGRLGVPLVLEVNGVLELDQRAFYRSLAEPVGRRVERRKYETADAIVTTSPTLAAELVARGAREDRVRVVPYAVPDELLALPRQDRPDDADVVVGWIGHGLAWHGLGLLADAAARIGAELPQAVFRVVGSGPSVEALQSRVEGDVSARFEFAGAVATAGVPRILSTFDIGVVPENPTERFPIKLLEMAAAGAAIVAPLVPCITDFLTPGDHFEPFEQGDVDGLADAIRRLVADPNRRTAIAGALRALVAEEFSVDAAAERLRAVVAGLQE